MVRRNATITQCVMLRPDWRPNGDRALLAWVMREFIRYGVTDFLLPASPEATENAIAGIRARLPRPVRIRTVPEDPAQTGSKPLLIRADAWLQDRFLLCTGETIPPENVAELLAEAAWDGTDAMEWAFSDDDVCLLDKRILDQLKADGVFTKRSSDVGPTSDVNRPLRQPGLERGRDNLGLAPSGPPDLGTTLARQGLLPGHVPTDGACDRPVPPGPVDALRRRALSADALRRRALFVDALRRRALFLDRDGVLNVDHGYIGTRDRFEWIDGALDAIRYATQAGWHVFIVTNQSGVARGLYTEAAVADLLNWIADEARAVGGTVDDTRFCPFHPEAVVDAYRQAHPWRKPLPGMVLDLIEKWELDPAYAVMVGDQETDMRAAAAAGVAGHLFPGGNLLSFLRPILDEPA